MKDSTIKTKLSGWTPLFDVITEQYSPAVSAVYGCIWRHCKMRDGVCRASQERMAELVGLSVSTVRRHADTLEDGGYITCTEAKQGRSKQYLTTGKTELESLIGVRQTERQTPVKLADEDTIKDTNKDIKDLTQTFPTEWGDFIERWSVYFPDKPQPRKQSLGLMTKLRTRTKDKFFQDNYEKALQKASQSNLCCKSNWFQASWFLDNPGNWEKCLNGNYDNQASPFGGQSGLEAQPAVPPPASKEEVENAKLISQEQVDEWETPWK